MGEPLTEEVMPPKISKKVEKILEFIFKIMTQLRVISGMQNTVIGFDYPAIFATADVYGFKVDADVMDLIRTAEGIIVDNYRKKG